jgi:hypothetical protein
VLSHTLQDTLQDLMMNRRISAPVSLNRILRSFQATYQHVMRACASCMPVSGWGLVPQLTPGQVKEHAFQVGLQDFDRGHGDADLTAGGDNSEQGLLGVAGLHCQLVVGDRYPLHVRQGGNAGRHSLPELGDADANKPLPQIVDRLARRTQGDLLRNHADEALDHCSLRHDVESGNSGLAGRWR